ncbi:unnamed protein product [Sphenostylis stenocarpa]|uniref:Uncharacterized protein n=1 Tax=Sphenostylis stenocarpa TaxID=92480 RepID=A0AA86T0U7_9FABA|nr:unnamed protein product [Sphenostylis stenocarpa]
MGIVRRESVENGKVMMREVWEVQITTRLQPACGMPTLSSIILVNISWPLAIPSTKRVRLDD